ncbi:MAG: hypothetical protein KC503_41700 [Myxococcales bacterium]|nr:hypothetical protein [Myxococcales bacterium]
MNRRLDSPAAAERRDGPSAEQLETLEVIVRRALALATAMIYDANHRGDAADGDPKVGGHPAAASSALHICAALHLWVRRPSDIIAGKPHASPSDHALSFLLGLMRDARSGRWLDDDAAARAMTRLRDFPRDGEPVFQSYHAESDPDAHRMLPAGSVGIPAVVGLFVALAYRYAEANGLLEGLSADARAPHVYAIVGDSELREGSLLEALPEASERGLCNVTWIVDYNRQSLDGARVAGHGALGVADSERIARMAAANGWRVVELRHGARRRAAFEAPAGEALRRAFEALDDYELTSLLFRHARAASDADARAAAAAATRRQLRKRDEGAASALEALDDDRVAELLADLGGHDLAALVDALEDARSAPQPTLIIAHTLKGWGLEMAAAPGNHSALPDAQEVDALLARAGLPSARAGEQGPARAHESYRRFDAPSAAATLCTRRGEALRRGFESLWAESAARLDTVRRRAPAMPDSLAINLALMPMAHTQWMWGQIAAKLARIGSARDASELAPAEQPLLAVAQHALTLSPDVGTSTNIAAVMNERVFGAAPEADYPSLLEAHDRRRPALTPREGAGTRHLRFEIAESNCMLAAGAFGKMSALCGAPLLPLMTIYDFFIKRALDQLYYNLYWGSSFVVVATPSGVTLSAEGAQHSWKSDIQMPNLICWEPMFAAEMDWIFADALRRHLASDNAGRSGVVVRAVTRGLPQRALLERLRARAENAGRDDAQLLEVLRGDVLAGGYRLVDHRGREGYQPGDNVVEILALGAMGREALDASEALEARGIFANVTIVTSADLLLGTLGARDDYAHLRQRLGFDGRLHLARATHAQHAASSTVRDRADLVLAAGRRVPIVSVCDGEPGLLDNAGSIVGVQQLALGVRRASKCGRLADVYAYHGIDGASIARACGRALAQTATEDVVINKNILSAAIDVPARKVPDWRTLWRPEDDDATPI